ncbi:hypothetical protein EXIGLDRAFT_758293 [Exidia glandulosa HHB12029]|uniref:DUF7719 domain-containing protein n=1 Tax=Exidia glandulosa HHB12029 TaxID=1314781 RepID=A0A165QRK4_EXIGL|nr:hypothetical protein EXIGLDRAFT_758293 [Exidia glandulosa HHB12029]
MPSKTKSKSRRNAAERPADQVEPGTVPEDEQWRLINESGVLGQMHEIPRPEAQDEAENSVDMPLFDAFLLFVPFTFFYVLMDILIHQQYGQHPTFKDLLSRLSNAAPILALFVYFSNTRKSKWWMQALLFAAGVGCGCRLVFHLNISSWTIVMQQAPPLATVWVYTILQLRLHYAVASLAVVYAWLWQAGLKLII